MRPDDPPLVSVIMGSKSDWETLAPRGRDAHPVRRAPRVPRRLRPPHAGLDGASSRRGAEERGIEVIIAGAGGAAHLPGMVAAQTLLPVLGVPVQSQALNGLDSLLSIVQMPAGVPVGTLAIGKAGAANAALLAVRILAAHPAGAAREAARRSSTSRRAGCATRRCLEPP